MVHETVHRSEECLQATIRRLAPLIMAVMQHGPRLVAASVVAEDEVATVLGRCRMVIHRRKPTVMATQTLRLSLQDTNRLYFKHHVATTSILTRRLEEEEDTVGLRVRHHYPWTATTLHGSDIHMVLSRRSHQCRHTALGCTT